MKTLIRIFAIATFFAFFFLNFSIITNDNNKQSISIIKEADAGIFGGNKIPCFSSIDIGTGKIIVFCSDCDERECEDRDTSGKCVPSTSGGGGNIGD